MQTITLKGFKCQVRELMSSCIYSSLAYNEPVLIKDRLNKLNLLNIRLIKFYDGKSICKRDAQAFMFSSEKKMVLAFRGTMSRDDMLDAIDIRKSLFEETGAKIHHGFHQQFKSLEPILSEDIGEAFKRDIDEIYFVGHSMGGAVAAIAASFYALSKPDRVRIICHTFGNPHFADEVLSNTIQDKVDEHICVQAKDDIIPLIPIYPDFKHLPNILEVDSRGVPSCMIDFELSYMHFVKKVMNAGNVPAIYKHHSCVEYYNLLLLLSKRLGTLELIYSKSSQKLPL